MEAAPNQKPATLTSPPAWVYYNRAYVRLDLKQFDAALADMSQAITLDPSDSDAYMTRAQIRIHLQQWDEAQHDYQAALKHNRENPLQAVIQAQIAAGMQHYEQALKLMNESIQRPLFTPLQRPEMHLYRGRIYAQLVRTNAAMSDYCHYRNRGLFTGPLGILELIDTSLHIEHTFWYDTRTDTHIPGSHTVESIDSWTDQLMEVERKFAESHEILSQLQRDLKDAGRKKDMLAIAEVVERLGRYGRLFEDIRQSWTEVSD
jgi:tetratricopeptide (TPR) repeat protein